MVTGDETVAVAYLPIASSPPDQFPKSSSSSGEAENPRSSTTPMAPRILYRDAGLDDDSEDDLPAGLLGGSGGGGGGGGGGGDGGGGGGGGGAVEEFAAEEAAIPIHVAGSVQGQYIEVTCLADIMSVINFPRLYREFDRICVLEFPFVDAPHLLETILEVGKPGEEKTWLIGNLPELIEITRFRVAFLRVSSSLERLLSLWKTHGILEIDWDFIGAVEHAVAALHPLSDHQPEALRNGVLGLLERLKLLFPVQPDDADSTDIIASTKLVSDVELIVKDMSLLGLIPIKYPALRDQSAFLPVSVVENQPDVQESPYIRIRSYNELLLTMDSQFPIDICIVSFKLSDATKVSHRVDKAIEKGWWVGNIDILHTTSHFRSIISRISESISNLQMTLLEGEIDWFEIKRIKQLKDRITALCDNQPMELCNITFEFFTNIDTVLSEFPPFLLT